MGCKFGGAKRIVAVDLMPEKFESGELRIFMNKFKFVMQFSAKIFGATEFVNPKMELPEGKTLTQFLREKYDGGFDYTFEATGNVLAMVRAWGNEHLWHFIILNNYLIIKLHFSQFSVKLWSRRTKPGANRAFWAFPTRK
jgi:Zn-dependent alcohol dehydrogenase